jgi:hypothetical protein
VIVLIRGQAVDPGHPAGMLFIGQNQGQIVPAASLAFRILAPDGTQYFPGSGTQTVDLTNDVVVTDPNGAAGVYVARWTVPSMAPVGRYAIEWTYELTTPASATFTSVQTEPSPSGVALQFFDIIATGVIPPIPLYALPSDVREDLGCTPENVSDARLLKIIGLAGLMVERMTGRVFEPRAKFVRLGGNSSRHLQLGEPIVAVSSVGIDTQPTQNGDLVIDLDLIRIYNRHLSQGLIQPDDRNDPQLEFVHSDDLYGVRFIPFRGISLRSLAWPVGVQNVHVRGFFGYTEPDGTPWGATPLLLQHAIKLIVARELPKIGSKDAREDAQWRWRVTTDKAKDIEVDLVAPRKWGEFFGDPELDSILISFIRPPSFGSA